MLTWDDKLLRDIEDLEELRTIVNSQLRSWVKPKVAGGLVAESTALACLS